MVGEHVHDDMPNKKPIIERSRDKILERIKANPHTTAYNNEMIERMVAWAQANERDEKTVLKYLSAWSVSSSCLAGG